MNSSMLYIIGVAGMAHVFWQALARQHFQATGHVRERLAYVNFGLGLALGILCLELMLHAFDVDTRPWLGQFAFVIWTGAVLLILLKSTLPKSLRMASATLVLGAVLVLFFFDGGPEAFLSKIDDFVHASNGESRGGLNPSDFIRWIFYFVHAFAILNFYGRMYEIGYRDRVERGEIKESLHEDAIERSVAFVSFGIACFVALCFVGTDIKALGLFSGLMAAGLTVALKDLLANFFAGIFLLMDKSLKIDDVISIGDNKYGMVKSMTMRYLVLEDRNEIRYLIPNSDFVRKPVTNWTHNDHTVRLKVDVGVAYGSDIQKVQELMEGLCLKVGRIVADPPPRALVIGPGDSAINLQLRFFIADPENGMKNVMSDVYSLLLDTFRLEGISIPYPQREIHVVAEKPEETKKH